MPIVPELRTQLKGPKINIGPYTYAAGSIKIIGPYPIKIGKFCSFAKGIEFLITAGHHTNCVSTFPFDNLDNWPEANRPLYQHHKGLEINIGNDVWIGYKVKIMHNAPIGDGSVIGAYSVVREAVRPYAIVIGNPAKEVARRFDDETIERLLELKWWDWPEEKIRKHVDIISSPNIERIFDVN